MDGRVGREGRLVGKVLGRCEMVWEGEGGQVK